MEYLQKHRTVGISMHPDLEKRAKAQATSLGLKFSPYVTLCIEAEMRGMANILNKPTEKRTPTVTFAQSYMEDKSTSEDFRQSVEYALKESNADYIRNIRIDSFLADFGISTSRGIIALECCPHIHTHYPLALGQSILLKGSKRISEVVLIAPYLKGFNQEVKKQLDAFKIKLSSPDILKQTLKPLLKRFS
jgi:hypothetical protein